MVEDISSFEGVGDIIILDNDSTYPPLLEWYSTNPCTVVMLGKNWGHRALWESGYISNITTDYVMTDPDLFLSDIPKDVLLYLKDKLTLHPIGKIGLGLDWECVSPESRYYSHLQSYEKPRWTNSTVKDNVYFGVGIDTTFALYDKSVKQHFTGGASVGRPYVAKHIPWQFTVDERNANDEFMYYLNHANSSCSYKRFI